MTSFAALGVPQALCDALASTGIETPTPIQAATLPDSLAGRDVLGRGRTGSGKTFAFLLPLVAELSADKRRRTPKRPRALVLAPTRELVAQIEESLEILEPSTGLRSVTVFGGVNANPQIRALAQGADIVLACPGRLLDLMDQKALDLSEVSICVLDEADHMADMGFLPMVKRILDRVPSTAQKMLFSATLDNGIDVLVKRYLHQPVVHEADSALSPVGEMDHHVVEVTKDTKVDVVADLASAPGKTIVFTRTKYGAKKLAKQLVNEGIPAVELHGNLAQNARTRNMDAFHSDRVSTLVATDIAARGIHVDDVTLVIHADPPAEHKAYLHRSGRTARAGKAGTVVTIATPDQRAEVRSLMRAAKIHPTVTGSDAASLQSLAPGERVRLTAAEASEIAHPGAAQASAAAQGGGRRPASSGGRQGGRPSGKSSGGSRQAGKSTGNGGSRQAVAPSGRGGGRPAGTPAGSGSGSRPQGRRSDQARRGDAPRQGQGSRRPR